jgi:hypothetical protein
MVWRGVAGYGEAESQRKGDNEMAEKMKDQNKGGEDRVKDMKQEQQKKLDKVADYPEDRGGPKKDDPKGS